MIYEVVRNTANGLLTEVVEADYSTLVAGLDTVVFYNKQPAEQGKFQTALGVALFTKVSSIVKQESK